MDGDVARTNPFIELRENGGYYIDKTMLVKDVLRYGVYIVCLRPHGFGNSMNLAMLDAFFNIEYKGNTWFDGLEVSEHPELEKHKNAYPVLHIDLKDTVSDDAEEFCTKLETSLMEVCDRFAPFSYPDGKRCSMSMVYEAMKSDRKWCASYSMCDLTKYLSERYGNDVIILVDNLDLAVVAHQGTETCRKIMDELGYLMASIMKGNTHAEYGFVSGTLRIMESGLNPSWNNYCTYTTINDRLGRRYGFTESDVIGLLAHHGQSEKLDEAREWYGGFMFDGTEMYNPGSVMKYIENGFTPGVHIDIPANRSALDCVLENIESTCMDRVLELLKGGSLDHEIDCCMYYRGDDYMRLDNISFMLHYGFLKAASVRLKDGYYKCIVSIPNREVKEFFIKDCKRRSCEKASIPVSQYDCLACFDYILKDADIVATDGESNCYKFLLPLICSAMEDHDLDVMEYEGCSIVVLRSRTGGTDIIISYDDSYLNKEPARVAEEELRLIRGKMQQECRPGSTRLYVIASYWNKYSVRTDTINL